MKKLNKNKIALGLATLVMGLGGNAMAAEETATAQVNASVLRTCKVSFPNNITLTYNHLNGSDVNSSFDVICTKVTPYEIGVSTGLGNSDSERVMKFGENSLSYTLEVSHSGRYKNWGDIGSPRGTLQQWGVGTVSSIEYRINVPSLQYIEAGSYTDELVVTFNY